MLLRDVYVLNGGSACSRPNENSPIASVCRVNVCEIEKTVNCKKSARTLLRILDMKS